LKIIGRKTFWLLLGAAFIAFVVISLATGFAPGKEMGTTFGSTLLTMMQLLPCAFILIGLFDVWIKRETIEKHMGNNSGLRGYFWSILLAGTTVGGLYLAFPFAYSLYRKGAALGVIFAYVGLAGVCRIPMTMFEISFMGPAFTAARLLVSVPLIIFSSMIMGRILNNYDYRISESTGNNPG
jgi:uncharacterized membrane protein YraQ (UPF0718 family)